MRTTLTGLQDCMGDASLRRQKYLCTKYHAADCPCGLLRFKVREVISVAICDLFVFVFHFVPNTQPNPSKTLKQFTARNS